jgi:hypothetical protein
MAESTPDPKCSGCGVSLPIGQIVCQCLFGKTHAYCIDCSSCEKRATGIMKFEFTPDDEPPTR